MSIGVYNVSIGVYNVSIKIHNVSMGVCYVPKEVYDVSTEELRMFL